MTLVVAAPSRNFLVLGADSRGTVQDSGGARVEMNQMKKIVPLAKHVAVLLYGAADQGVYLARKFLPANRNIDGVTKAAEKFADFCRDEIRKVSDVPRQYFPLFGFIVAGLDRRGNSYSIPACYRFDSASGCMLGSPDPYAIAGKPFIAQYLFEQRYAENMGVDELCALVAQCIYDTICVDGDVGGRIRVAIVDEVGFRERPFKHVKASIKQWGEPLV